MAYSVLLTEDAHTYSEFVDDGCEVSPRCLECPLSACRYDDPVPFQMWKIEHDPTRQPQWERFLQMAGAGISTEHMAGVLALSRKTVQRWRKNISRPPRRSRRGMNVESIAPQLTQQVQQGLTRREVRAYWGVSRGTLSKWLNQLELIPVRDTLNMGRRRKAQSYGRPSRMTAQTS